MNKRILAWDNMPECFGLNLLSLLPLPSSTQKSKQAKSLGLALTYHQVLLDCVFLELKGVWIWPRGKCVMDFGKGHTLQLTLATTMPLYTEASRLLCTAADNSCWFCVAAGASVTNFCGSCFFANTADAPTWGMSLIHFGASLFNISDVFVGSHPWKLPEYPILYLQISIVLSHLHSTE